MPAGGQKGARQRGNEVPSANLGPGTRLEPAPATSTHRGYGRNSTDGWLADDPQRVPPRPRACGVGGAGFGVQERGFNSSGRAVPLPGGSAVSPSRDHRHRSAPCLPPLQDGPVVVDEVHGVAPKSQCGYWALSDNTAPRCPVPCLVVMRYHVLQECCCCEGCCWRCCCCCFRKNIAACCCCKDVGAAARMLPAAPATPATPAERI
jgi:hypothetical protein